MRPNYVTIITPIATGRVEVVRQYLRDHAEPRVGCGAKLIQCRPLFRFDQVKAIHFCSFVILSGDDVYEPNLIFEATFDGPRTDFLRELWRVAGAGLHAVYDHCVGYPKSGLAVPELIEEYLVLHDIGAHAFFSGSPGRTVAQIEGECRLRREMVNFLAARNGANDPVPATSLGLQQAVQCEFVRGRAENRWAEGPAAMPWEWTNRQWVARAFALMLLLVACALGTYLIHRLWGLGPIAVRDWIEQRHEDSRRIGLEIAAATSPAWEWVGNLIGEFRLPALYVVAALSATWGVVRIAELFLKSCTEDPRDQSFFLRFPLHIAIVLKYALPVVLVGFVALQIAPDSRTRAISFAEKPSQLSVILQNFDKRVAKMAVGEDVAPTFTATFVLVAAIAFIWALLAYCTTSLKLIVQFQELSRSAENWRRFLIDVLRFAQIVAVVIAVLIIGRHIPDSIGEQLADYARPRILGLLVVVAYVFTGIVALFALEFALFFVVRACELIDQLRFKRARDLTRALDNGRVYAREEGGINRYQNHLASVSHVKPGLLRQCFVRITLFVINLLSRYWFNRGDLCGIPTILSARWVLIDRGRRLLFLDNYTGAWDSYLNEFIDMGAVKGLNAIWSNTFVKTPEGKEHAWPETKFYFWHGAQAEGPFKAYVRQTQVETLVWYGAYPTLSITNINANTEIRQSLFRPLTPCDLDSLIQRL